LGREIIVEGKELDCPELFMKYVPTKEKGDLLLKIIQPTHKKNSFSGMPILG